MVPVSNPERLTFHPQPRQQAPDPASGEYPVPSLDVFRGALEASGLGPVPVIFVRFSERHPTAGHLLFF